MSFYPPLVPFTASAAHTTSSPSLASSMSSSSGMPVQWVGTGRTVACPPSAQTDRSNLRQESKRDPIPAGAFIADLSRRDSDPRMRRAASPVDTQHPPASTQPLALKDRKRQTPTNVVPPLDARLTPSRSPGRSQQVAKLQDLAVQGGVREAPVAGTEAFMKRMLAIAQSEVPGRRAIPGSVFDGLARALGPRTPDELGGILEACSRGLATQSPAKQQRAVMLLSGFMKLDKLQRVAEQLVCAPKKVPIEEMESAMRTLARELRSGVPQPRALKRILSTLARMDRPAYDVGRLAFAWAQELGQTLRDGDNTAQMGIYLFEAKYPHEGLKAAWKTGVEAALAKPPVPR